MTDPEAGFNAYSVPDEGSIAHTAPAETMGEPSWGRGVRQATEREVGVTESAYKPSAHGTKTVESSHADPPQAPEHTRRLATWPPIPPSAPAARRLPRASLPIT